MLCGLDAWRSLQSVSISLLGSVLIFVTSKKESSVLMPGGGALGSRGFGGEGGAGHGEDPAGGELDVDDGEGGGVRGPVAPGTTADLLSSSIFSLCFSFNSLMSLTPSSFALEASLSAYFDRILASAPWVARKRTSCTCAQRR